MKGLRVITLLAVAACAACRQPMPPIRQHGAWLVVENQTKTPWRDVSVTVNAYYRGVSPTVAAGARLEAPLASFVSGLGRRFDTAREHVMRVEVRATDASGQPVALDWDEKTDKPLLVEPPQPGR